MISDLTDPSDIEALRPKSPVRGGSSNIQNNQQPKPPQQHNQQQQQQQHHHQMQQQQQQHINNMNLMNMGMNMGQPQFPNHPMMVPQMMAMANGMDQMGMMGWPPGGGMNINMLGPQGFQRPPGFNPMQGMQMQMGMPGMMPTWIDPNFAAPDGVWNPAMMGMPGPHNMGGGGMSMDMGQWGPFGFQ
jgi:hypothetical protein